MDIHGLNSLLKNVAKIKIKGESALHGELHEQLACAFPTPCMITETIRNTERGLWTVYYF